MSSQIEFSRQIDAQSSLRLYSRSCRAACEDMYQWKFVILSAHNSLQGFMTCALKGSNSFDTWKEAHFKKWMKAYRSNQSLPWPQLDIFMNLYDKLFDDGIESQRWRINWLNSQRNEFVHFNNDSFILCLRTAFNCCEEAIKLIALCKDRSRGIFFYEEEDEISFYSALDEAQRSTAQLAISLNKTVQPTANVPCSLESASRPGTLTSPLLWIG